MGDATRKSACFSQSRELFWVESSALAKAEWIKFFGVLFNKEKEADSIFNQIENIISMPI